MYNLLLDPKKSSNKVSSKPLMTGVSRINPQEVWVHDVTNKALINQKRLDSIEQTLEQLLKINKSVPEILNPDLNNSSLERTKTLREDLNNILQTTNPKISSPIAPVTNSSVTNEITEPKNQFRTSKLAGRENRFPDLPPFRTSSCPIKAMGSRQLCLRSYIILKIAYGRF